MLIGSLAPLGMLGEHFQQNSCHVLSHDLVDVLLGDSFLKKRVCKQGPAAGIEGSGDAAVEIGAKRNVVRADNVYSVVNGACNGARIGAASCGIHRPIPMTPLVRATARSSSSDKLRGLLQVPFTPV